MAIEDLIVQSGRQMSRDITEGWLGTPQSRRQDRLDKFNMEQKRLLNQRQAESDVRAQESHVMLQKQKKLTIQKLERDLEGKTPQEVAKELRDNETEAAAVEGAYNAFAKNPSMARQIISKHAENETNEEDKAAFQQMIELSDTELGQQLEMARGVLPEVLDFTRKMKEQEARKSGGSAFERMLEQSGFDQETKAELVKTYLKTKSGREMTASQKDKAARAKRDAGIKVRKEYADVSKHTRQMNQQIDAAQAALSVGEAGMLDTAAIQSVAGIMNSSIRAMAMYDEFNTGQGHIAQRAANSISKLVTGTITDQTRAKLQEQLAVMRDAYSGVNAQKYRDRYREIAKDSGLDPYLVVPPENLDDLKQGVKDKRISGKEAARLARKYGFKVPPK